MVKLQGQHDGAGRKFAIVASRWNELVVKALVEGAHETLAAAGADDVIEILVPGAWEIPLVCQALVEARQVDGIIALGCIVQGETAHAGMLASEVSGALMGLQSNTGVPVSWGVLTPEDALQALDRAGMKHGNKGREAAAACLEMVNLLDQLRAEG